MKHEVSLVYVNVLLLGASVVLFSDYRQYYHAWTCVWIFISDVCCILAVPLLYWRQEAALMNLLPKPDIT